jgi:hypothetical protein
VAKRDGYDLTDSVDQGDFVAHNPGEREAAKVEDQDIFEWGKLLSWTPSYNSNNQDEEQITGSCAQNSEYRHEKSQLDEVSTDTLRSAVSLGSSLEEPTAREVAAAPAHPERSAGIWTRLRSAHLTPFQHEIEEQAMRVVIFGLTVSSSWGDGHVTLWRGMLKAMSRRGYRVTFYERDLPYYASTRDHWWPLTGVTVRLLESVRSIRDEATAVRQVPTSRSS